MYPVIMVTQMLGISSHRLRNWEQRGLVIPKVRNNKRCYSDLDLQRLIFIKHLLDNERLRVSTLPNYLAWYPCWQDGQCPDGARIREGRGGVRSCWQKRGWYCLGKTVEEGKGYGHS